jgi:hypothetical protein
MVKKTKKKKNVNGLLAINYIENQLFRFLEGL